MATRGKAPESPVDIPGYPSLSCAVAAAGAGSAANEDPMTQQKARYDVIDRNAGLAFGSLGVSAKSRGHRMESDRGSSTG